MGLQFAVSHVLGATWIHLHDSVLSARRVDDGPYATDFSNYPADEQSQIDG